MVKLGDIVVIHEDNLQRGLWKLELVQKPIIGKDGLTRGAVVKTRTHNQDRSTTLRRPLQRLYPLECIATDPQSSDEPVAVDRFGPVPEDRTRRAAAVRADQDRRLLIHNQEL